MTPHLLGLYLQSIVFSDEPRKHIYHLHTYWIFSPSSRLFLLVVSVNHCGRRVLPLPCVLIIMQQAAGSNQRPQQREIPPQRATVAPVLYKRRRSRRRLWFAILLPLYEIKNNVTTQVRLD